MKFIVGIAAVLVAAFGFAAAGSANGQDKITICHAAGLAGTTHFVTLELAAPAVFGPAGHFFENGTPRAGHEQDYMGACRTENPPPPPPPPGPPPPPPPCQDCEPTPHNPPPPAPPPPHCTVDCNPCPPGQHQGGKDGEPGNDDTCVPDQQTPPPPPAPPAVTPPVEPPPVVTPPAPPAPQAPPVKKPKPVVTKEHDSDGNVVIVKKHSDGSVEIARPGKPFVAAVKGSG